MSLRGLLQQLCTLTRKTDLVLDLTTGTASMTADRQPAVASYLKITLAGFTDGSGTIRVNGTVDGVSNINEIFTFTGNDFVIGSKEFTAIASITLNNLVDETTVGTIKIQTISDRNAPLYQTKTIRTNEPCRLWRKTSGIATAVVGQIDQDKDQLFLGYSNAWTPQAEDRVAIGSDNWRLEGDPKLRRARRKAHHWECGLQSLSR